MLKGQVHIDVIPELSFFSTSVLVYVDYQQVSLCVISCFSDLKACPRGVCRQSLMIPGIHTYINAIYMQ